MNAIMQLIALTCGPVQFEPTGLTSKPVRARVKGPGEMNIDGLPEDKTKDSTALGMTPELAALELLARVRALKGQKRVQSGERD